MSYKTVLVVGATGSIGHLVVEEGVRQGYAVRALVRTPSKARRFPAQVEVISGDVTRPGTLTAAVDGIDAIVFTLGSDGAGKVGAESVDYAGVRNVLHALGSRTARIALMTSIGVTNRTGSYNRSTEAHDLPLPEFKDAPVVRRLKTKSRRRKPPNSDRVRALLSAPPTMPTMSQRPLPFDRSPLLLDD